MEEFTIQLYDIPHNFYTEIARETVNHIKADGTCSKTQVRNFYNAFLVAYNDIVLANQSELINTPNKLHLLIPQANGKLSKGSINIAFYNFLNHYLNQINTKKELESFKYFFEAIICFYDMENT